MNAGNSPSMERPAMKPMINGFDDPTLGELDVLLRVVDLVVKQQQAVAIEPPFELPNVTPVGRRLPSIQFFEQNFIVPKASKIVDAAFVKAAGGENVDRREACKWELCARS